MEDKKLDDKFGTDSGLNLSLGACLGLGVISHLFNSVAPFSGAGSIGEIVGGALLPLGIGVVIGLIRKGLGAKGPTAKILQSSIFYTAAVLGVLVFIGILNR